MFERCNIDIPVILSTDYEPDSSFTYFDLRNVYIPPRPLRSCISFLLDLNLNHELP